MRKGLLAALLGAVLVAGCGAVAPGASASPSATPSVVLTEADAGHTVQLHVGEQALLKLTNRYAWSGPQASGPAVRIASAGSDAWTVTAVSPGNARVSSDGKPLCSPGQLCPNLVLAFSLTVVVT